MMVVMVVVLGLFRWVYRDGNGWKFADLRGNFSGRHLLRCKKMKTGKNEAFITLANIL